MDITPLSGCNVACGNSATTESDNYQQEQNHGKSGGLSVRSIDDSLSLPIIKQAILDNPDLAAKTALACRIKPRLINPHTRILKNTKTATPEKDTAANFIAERILEKLAAGDKTLQTRIQAILNPPQINCPDNDSEKQATTNKYIVDQNIAKAEVRDPSFALAHERCKHTLYDQETGRFQTHHLEAVRYSHTHRNKESLACVEFEKLLKKPYLPPEYLLNHDDSITRTTVSVNTLHGIKLFRVAQCIFSAIKVHIDPEEFDSLSVKIRVLHGYPAERLLNMQSVQNEQGEYFYDCNVLDNTDDSLVFSKNIIDIVFSDLQTLIDFAESNETFDTLDTNGKIKIEMLSSSPSEKPAMNPEFLITKLKSTLIEQQGLFKLRNTANNIFKPFRPTSEVSALERYSTMNTWSKGVFATDPLWGDRSIDRQTFFVEGDILKSHPVHKLN